MIVIFVSYSSLVYCVIDTIMQRFRFDSTVYCKELLQYVDWTNI